MRPVNISIINPYIPIKPLDKDKIIKEKKIKNVIKTKKTKSLLQIVLGKIYKNQLDLEGIKKELGTKDEKYVNILKEIASLKTRVQSIGNLKSFLTKHFTIIYSFESTACLITNDKLFKYCEFLKYTYNNSTYKYLTNDSFNLEYIGYFSQNVIYLDEKKENFSKKKKEYKFLKCFVEDFNINFSCPTPYCGQRINLVVDSKYKIEDFVYVLYYCKFHEINKNDINISEYLKNGYEEYIDFYNENKIDVPIVIKYNKKDPEPYIEQIVDIWKRQKIFAYDSNDLTYKDTLHMNRLKGGVYYANIFSHATNVMSNDVYIPLYTKAKFLHSFQFKYDTSYFFLKNTDYNNNSVTSIPYISYNLENLDTIIQLSKIYNFICPNSLICKYYSDITYKILYEYIQLDNDLFKPLFKLWKGFLKVIKLFLDGSKNKMDLDKYKLAFDSSIKWLGEYETYMESLYDINHLLRLALTALNLPDYALFVDKAKQIVNGIKFTTNILINRVIPDIMSTKEVENVLRGILIEIYNHFYQTVYIEKDQEYINKGFIPFCRSPFHILGNIIGAISGDDDFDYTEETRKKLETYSESIKKFIHTEKKKYDEHMDIDFDLEKAKEEGINEGKLLALDNLYKNYSTDPNSNLSIQILKDIATALGYDFDKLKFKINPLIENKLTEIKTETNNTIRTLKNQTELYKKQIEEANYKINKLNDDLVKASNEYEEKMNEFKNLDNIKNKEYTEKINQLNKLINDYQNQIKYYETKDIDSEYDKKHIIDLNNKLREAQNQLNNSKKIYEDLQQEYKIQSNTIKDLNEKIEKAKSELYFTNLNKDKIDEEYKSQEFILKEKIKALNESEEKLKNKYKEELLKAQTSYEEKIKQLNIDNQKILEIAKKEKDLIENKLKNEILNKQNIIQKLEQENNEYKLNIDNLQKENLDIKNKLENSSGIEKEKFEKLKKAKEDNELEYIKQIETNNKKIKELENNIKNLINKSIDPKEIKKNELENIKREMAIINKFSGEYDPDYNYYKAEKQRLAELNTKYKDLFNQIQEQEKINKELRYSPLIILAHLYTEGFWNNNYIKYNPLFNDFSYLPQIEFNEKLSMSYYYFNREFKLMYALGSYENPIYTPLDFLFAEMISLYYKRNCDLNILKNIDSVDYFNENSCLNFLKISLMNFISDSQINNISYIYQNVIEMIYLHYYIKSIDSLKNILLKFSDFLIKYNNLGEEKNFKKYMVYKCGSISCCVILFHSLFENYLSYKITKINSLDQKTDPPIKNIYEFICIFIRLFFTEDQYAFFQENIIKFFKIKFKYLENYTPKDFKVMWNRGFSLISKNIRKDEFLNFNKFNLKIYFEFLNNLKKPDINYEDYRKLSKKTSKYDIENTRSKLYRIKRSKKTQEDIIPPPDIQNENIPNLNMHNELAIENNNNNIVPINPSNSDNIIINDIDMR